MEWASGGFSGTRQYARDKCASAWAAPLPATEPASSLSVSHPAVVLSLLRLWSHNERPPPNALSPHAGGGRLRTRSGGRSRRRTRGSDSTACTRVSSHWRARLTRSCWSVLSFPHPAVPLGPPRQKVKGLPAASGWAGTEALKKGMTSFYESTKDKLRTPEQAADTVVWCGSPGCFPRAARGVQRGGSPHQLTTSQHSPHHATDRLSVVSEEKLKNGAFYFDRMEAAKHISFAWTEYSKSQARAGPRGNVGGGRVMRVCRCAVWREARPTGVAGSDGEVHVLHCR